MSEQFGEDLFTEAFEIMKENKQDVFDDTTTKLAEKLSKLAFKDDD